ncbi:F-box protein CPR1-like [Populus alba x Populus x berolinensis]|uniref:F-box protein CPR1-like n=1 Tax=Populus alba x Populus x berolinensis TaxID=444605 RepID=A0AAD6WHW3_9ROSI|nr:F-box protein CPR1-like [Populus alba x Populus x berolinensis]
MSSFLPQDVLTDILARLPFKKILQCRCVSKTWYSLISSTTFATHHLNKTTKTKNNDILLFRYCPGESNGEIEHYFLYPDEGFPDNHLEELDCPFKSIWFGFSNIVGSCDGVVCLLDRGFVDNDRAALWNPSIRKTVSIPRPNVTFTSHGSFVNSLGFGFDSVSNDYKLVRVVYLQDCSFGFDEVPLLVEVYTMRRGCWRMITNDLKYVIREQSACAFLNGACHWFGYNSVERDEPRHAAVAFNLGDEVFVQIAVPDCLLWDHFIDVSFTVLDGMLSLVPCKKWLWGVTPTSVWVMKEYGVGESWTKLFNIEHLEGIERVVAFRENNEVLVAREYGELISYDPNTNNWDCKLFGDADSFYLDTFVESLVLLSEADRVLIENTSGNGEGEY